MNEPGEDRALLRIRRICEQYRGAEWALNYESDPSAWSMKITPPAPLEDDEVSTNRSPLGLLFSGSPQQYPVFAMRCDELDVIAESLEHWHARVLMRLPSQEPRDE